MSNICQSRFCCCIFLLLNYFALSINSHPFGIAPTRVKRQLLKNDLPEPCTLAQCCQKTAECTPVDCMFNEKTCKALADSGFLKNYGHAKRGVSEFSAQSARVANIQLDYAPQNGNTCYDIGKNNNKNSPATASTSLCLLSTWGTILYSTGRLERDVTTRGRISSIIVSHEPNLFTYTIRERNPTSLLKQTTTRTVLVSAAFDDVTSSLCRGPVNVIETIATAKVNSDAYVPIVLRPATAILGGSPPCDENGAPPPLAVDIAGNSQVFGSDDNGDGHNSDDFLSKFQLLPEAAIATQLAAANASALAATAADQKTHQHEAEVNNKSNNKSNMVVNATSNGSRTTLATYNTVIVHPSAPANTSEPIVDKIALQLARLIERLGY